MTKCVLLWCISYWQIKFVISGYKILVISPSPSNGLWNNNIFHFQTSGLRFACTTFFPSHSVHFGTLNSMFWLTEEHQAGELVQLQLPPARLFQSALNRFALHTYATGDALAWDAQTHSSTLRNSRLMYGRPHVRSSISRGLSVVSSCRGMIELSPARTAVMHSTFCSSLRRRLRTARAYTSLFSQLGCKDVQLGGEGEG